MVPSVLMVVVVPFSATMMMTVLSPVWALRVMVSGRMVDACRAQGVPEPEYEVAGGFVRIVFRRPEGAGVVNGDVNGDDRVNDSRNDSLSDSVNGTYQAIKANPGIQRKRISELTGKSIPTIDRHIALLAKSNLIEHRDSDKTGGYYVKKDEDRG